MNTQPIHAFAKWQVKQGHLDTVLNLLPELIRKSTLEKGNRLYQVYQDNSNVNGLLLYEAYEDESALQEHRNSEHFQTIVIGKIIPLLQGREVMLTTQLSL